MVSHPSGFGKPAPIRSKILSVSIIGMEDTFMLHCIPQLPTDIIARDGEAIA